MTRLKDTRKIYRILDLAKESEKKAATDLRRSQEELLSIQQQLGELRSWELGYLNQLSIQSNCSLRELKDVRLFLGELANAITEQEHRESIAHQTERQAFEQWKFYYKKQVSLRNLIERYETENAKKLEKEEQILADETSLKMYQKNPLE